MSEPERNYLVEVRMILLDHTLRLVIERAHLEAQAEWHEVQLIRLANQLEELKRRVLEME